MPAGSRTTTVTDMTRSPHDDALGVARRGLRAQRWTTVVTTTGTGVVLVALASRLGAPVAVAVAVVVVAAIGVALRNAVAGDRRWRRATHIDHSRRSEGEERRCASNT